ncbi:patatin family protein [Prevotella sp. A2931]|uniref:Patatin family protein n=1 Tax=Prevotella illustrans TaxID=2800387 RepID=A0ABS3M844_9BACT|nr:MULTISPECIES: patatin family protein [Prevotella]MBO1364357.1 patatin family protein [Prevotella illustrans]PTL25871.1 patatin family protein [Prevotella sp. oral taxon 820]
MKKGLVLEGGALRGLFSAGVIDVMMENHICIDGLVGVSAGAAFGCNYKSEQPGRAIRYNKKFAHDWRYCSLRSLITTGDLFGGHFCYHVLPTRLDVFDTATFDRNPMEFYVVCTDVTTGQAEYKLLMKHSHECYEWIRASASMPLASKVVEIGDKKLLDGGISDSIPLHFFQQKGYDRNVVVLTQPEGYVKKPNRLLPLMRWQLRRYPRFLEAAEQRHVMYNAQLAYVRAEERKGNTVVIRPTGELSIEHVSHDPAEMENVYQQGRQAALDKLPAILKLYQEE